MKQGGRDSVCRYLSLHKSHVTKVLCYTLIPHLYPEQAQDSVEEV